MSKFLGFLKRNWTIIPVMVLVMLVAGGLTYLTGMMGITHPAEQTVPTQIITAIPLQPGTPVSFYAQVDPAIIAYLNSAPADYAGTQLDKLGLSIQSIGAYLPRTGDTQFTISTPTPMPTPMPYETATPLPLPYMRTATPTPTLTPTIAPAAVYSPPRPAPLPYTPGVNECAPAGMPVQGILTQRFHSYHGGVDFGIPLGTPVLATHSGQVTFAGWSNIGYGYLVTLQSGAFTTYYAHNTSLNVAQGQFVGKGSIIAWSGSTGNSSGPHIHYEIRINDAVVDPLSFDQRGYPSC